MAIYTISIQNCNSIESADISISQGGLNIKYGPNGLGKSTIARAIIAAVNNDGALQDLKPFKFRALPSEHNPAVRGAENIGSVLLFDESYISQFVFQRDEVLKNSFDIFINTDDFMTSMHEIEGLLEGIKSAFHQNELLNSAVSDLMEIRDAFGFTKSGSLSKASKGYKAYGSGNKIENIPLRLKAFECFIKSEQPSSWISWQAKGNLFVDLSDNCPYCASDLREPEKKEVARQVAKEYDSKAVEHLSLLQAVINRLGKYFENSCRDSLHEITKSKIELSPEAENFLIALCRDVETLIRKLVGLREISFFSLRDVDRIEDEVARLKIDLGFLTKLNSPETNVIVQPINERLQALICEIGVLKGKINRNKSHIARSIVDNQNGINLFLKSAGYKYSVVIRAESDTYKMKLVHHDSDADIETATRHLSYGEKNAFALVLFMYQVLKDQPGLAILDDPVSSFDKTKKFAILNELFRGRTSLRNTTVLMLTHDIEPVVDVIRSVKNIFNDPKPSAYFLSSKNGIVTEVEVKAMDLQTFAQVCAANIETLADEIVKCVYLRRHFEIVNDLGYEYNFLSNILHGRPVPILKTESGEVEMSSSEILAAKLGVEKFIPEFDYNKMIAIISDPSEMKRRYQASCIGYDKLQLFRVYKGVHCAPTEESDDILRKFLNESFHIENEYVMQLNPHKYDSVPEYIIQECDRLILEM